MDKRVVKKGIIIVGMLLILYGLFNFIVLILGSFVAMARFLTPLLWHNITLVGQAKIVTLIPYYYEIFLLFNVGLLIAGAGIIELKRWASITGVVLVALFGIWRLTYVIKYYFRTSRLGMPNIMLNVPISIFIQLIISIGILIFLNLPKVREQFK